MFIKSKKEGHRFYITLSRPKKRNAFTPSMIKEIESAIHEANTDEEVKVVILNAEGPVFCAGMDLKAFNEDASAGNTSLGEVMSQLIKPSIAVVEGPVYAGGFLIIGECTFVLAKEEVTFTLPEVKLGLFPFQVLAGLLRSMPEKQALQLCLDPSPFDVQKALELGIVDDILTEDTLESILLRFESIPSAGVKAGIKVARSLRDVLPRERYSYLLQVLNDFKMGNSL
jgi:enoyl-CoA hydratase/carnithine racemase